MAPGRRAGALASNMLPAAGHAILSGIGFPTRQPSRTLPAAAGSAFGDDAS